jgi:hypothetical protein
VADLRRVLGRAAAVAALLAGVVACSAAPSNQVAGAPRPDPATTWSDTVCGSVLAFANAATAPPDFAAATDLAAVQRSYSAYLGALVAGVREGRSALAAAGNPPVPDGYAVADRVRTGLIRLEQDMTGAQAMVDGADPADPRGFVTAVRQVEQTVLAIEVPDVVAELATVPELAAATRTAPTCRTVRTLAAAAPG